MKLDTLMQDDTLLSEAVSVSANVKKVVTETQKFRSSIEPLLRTLMKSVEQSDYLAVDKMHTLLVDLSNQAKTISKIKG